MQSPETLTPMTYEEWCRLGGYTPEYAKTWLFYINHCRDWELGPPQKITKKMADAWVNEALG